MMIKRKGIVKGIVALATAAALALGYVPVSVVPETAQAAQAAEDQVNNANDFGRLVQGQGYYEVFETTRTYKLTSDITLQGYLKIPSGNFILTIDLNGHTLSRGLSNSTDNGFVIYNEGNLILKDSSTNGAGKLTGGKGTSYAGGVYVYGGSFTMEGGNITGNSTTGDSGGFGAGGVCVAGGTFKMNGGSISDNSAYSYGGGVCVYTSCSFEMTGGRISGNTSGADGGGVHVFYNGMFTMSGGEISGNNTSAGSGGRPAGGVSANGSYKLSGRPVVKDNFVNGEKSGGIYVKGDSGVASDVNQSVDRTSIIGALDESACVYFSNLNNLDNGTPQYYQPNFAIAKAGADYTITESDASRIHIDGESSLVRGIYNNAVYLRQPLSASDVTLPTDSFTYNRAVQTPAVTVNSNSETINSLVFKQNGVVKEFKNAGTYDVYITGTKYFSQEKVGTLTINPKPVTITGLSASNKVYDGTTTATTTGTATINGIIEGDNVTVSAGTAAFADANAGTDKPVTISGLTLGGTDKDNYTLASSGVSATGTITPKSITGATVTLNKERLEYNGSEQSVSVTGVTLDGKTLTTSDYEVTSGTTGTAKDTYTVTITGKGNYKDTATTNWQITNKLMTVTAPNVTATYDGQAHGIVVTVSDPGSGATIKYGDSADSCTLDASPTITNVSDSPKTVYFKVTADNYEDYTGSSTLTINKANVTGAPTYTKITSSGKKLADANLAVGSLVPDGGTIVWDAGNDTAVVQGTSYAWTYTPADTNNYNVKKGTIILWESTQGGGGTGGSGSGAGSGTGTGGSGSGGSGSGGSGSGGGSTPATSPAPSTAPGASPAPSAKPGESPAPSAVPGTSPAPSAAPGTSPAPTIVEQRTETTNNPDGTTTTTTTTVDSEGTKTTEAETALTDGSVEKVTDVVKADGSTEKVVETEHPDGSSEKTVDIVKADGSTEKSTETVKADGTSEKKTEIVEADGSTETISEKVKPNGATEKVTDIEKADGTAIHEDVKTSSKGTETSYRSETLPTGDKTVTEQVKQPSGDFSRTTTSTTVKTDDDGNIIDTSVKITVEVKTGTTTTRTSFSVISSEPVAKKNAIGSAAKLAAKGKMVSDFAARTSVSEQNKLAGSLDDIVSNQVALTKATTNAKSKTVTIPKTVKADGVTYSVVTLKKGMLKGNKKKPTKVKLRATGVTTVEKGAFKAMAKKGTIYVSGSKKQFKKLKKLIVKSGLPKGVKVKRA